MVEVFNLAFRLRPIRPTDFLREAVALCQTQKRGIPTVFMYPPKKKQEVFWREVSDLVDEVNIFRVSLKF